MEKRFRKKRKILKKVYYTHESACSGEHPLKNKLRIVYADQFICSLLGEQFYNTLEELKKKDNKFKKLMSSDNNWKHKITKEENISKPVEVIFVPTKDDFSNFDYSFLMHTTNGSRSKNNWSGIHKFNPQKHKILNITKECQHSGLWEAEIEVFNENSKKWIKKVNPSTFYPENWSVQQIDFECRQAFKYKVNINEQKILSVTYSGIGIIIVMDKLGENLKTIYPVFPKYCTQYLNPFAVECPYWKEIN